MKKTLSILLALILTFSACSAMAEIRFSIGGGNSTGVYYILAGALANLVTEKADGISATAEITAASIDNLNLMHAEEMEMGIANTDIMMYAYNGETANFPEAMPELRHIGKLYTSTMHIVVPAGSDIKSVADMKGKKVAVGAPGAGQRVYVDAILGEYGMTMDDIVAYDLGQSEMVDAMKDNQLHAIFLHSGFPNSAVTDLATSKDVELIDLPEDVVASLLEKHPYLGSFYIPAEAYGTSTGAMAVGAWNSVVAREDLDEEAVYQTTKLLFENVDYLAECHNILSNIDVTKSNTEEIPLHEGALRYYREIGLMD